MSTRVTVWVVDEDAGRGAGLVARLVKADRPAVAVGGLTTLLEAGEAPLAILLSLDGGEPDAIERLSRDRPETPLVVVGPGGEGAATATLRAGADEYVRRGSLTDDLLAQALRYAIDQRAARRALRQRMRMQGEIVDSMTECLVVVDASGRLVLANRAARLYGERYGLVELGSLGELAERVGLYDASSGARIAVERRPLRSALDGHVVVDRVARVSLGKATERWLRLSARPLRDGDSDEITGAFVLFRDITEAREADARLARLNAELEARVEARTAALEATNRELEAFSYAVSHDLREPLRALEGFSQALDEDYGDTLDEEGNLYIERISRATMRLTERIDALLTLSRVTRGVLRREAVDIGELARRSLESLQEREPERRVRWQVQDGLVVEADPPLVAIVVENLLHNAWKFSRDRDEAHVEVGRAEAGFFVRDDGVGMGESYVERVFDAFTRYHSEREFEGTGIGLTTVKRIVHRHGGRVWLESAEHQGTTVWFTLGGGAE